MLTIGFQFGLLLHFLCPETLLIQAVTLFKYLRKFHVIYPSTCKVPSSSSSSFWEVKRHPKQQDKCEVMSHNDEFCLDFERIRNCVYKLELSGWYYGQLSWQDATALLQKMAVGTFLMRDSSDPAYLFALSVQTERGPTSVRVHYLNGQFKLDAEDMIAGHMPLFDCAVQMVDYYVRLSGTDKARCHVWLDESGRRDRCIYLSRPLLHTTLTLKHLCRLTFNGNIPLQRVVNTASVILPKSVRTYLNEYPYLR